MTAFMLKRKAVARLLEDYSENFWSLNKVDLSASEKIYFRTAYINLKRLANLVIGLAIIAVLFSIVLPTMQEPRQLPLPCYQPWFLGYNELVLLQAFTLFFGALLPCLAFFLFMTTIVKLTELQFRLLKTKIQLCFSANDTETLYQDIKDIVNHHNFLLRFTEYINKTFGLNMLNACAFTSLGICVNTFIFSFSSNADTQKRAIAFILAESIVIVFALCKPSEDLKNECEKIREAVYLCPWQDYPELSKDYIIILANCERDVSLRTHFFKVNWEMLIQLGKRTFSYYTFLETMTSIE